MMTRGLLNLDFSRMLSVSCCGPYEDYSSVRGTRTVTFAVRSYYFSVTGDNGAKLFVSRQVKIGNCFSRSATNYGLRFFGWRHQGAGKQGLRLSKCGHFKSLTCLS